MSKRLPFLGDVPDTMRLSFGQRQQDIESHVYNIKRLNIALDAAAVVSRMLGFIPFGAKVEVEGARLQNFGGTRMNHAAHGMKRFAFNDRTIPDWLKLAKVDEDVVLMLVGLEGSTTLAPRTANLSIDKSLENNRDRADQLQAAMGHNYPKLPDAEAMVRDMMTQRAIFDGRILNNLRSIHAGEQDYLNMLKWYEDVLCFKPPMMGEAPEAMVRQAYMVLHDATPQSPTSKR